jgi:hypothetical protein
MYVVAGADAHRGQFSARERFTSPGQIRTVSWVTLTA